MSNAWWGTVFFSVVFVATVALFLPDAFVVALTGAALALAMTGTWELMARGDDE